MISYSYGMYHITFISLVYKYISLLLFSTKFYRTQIFLLLVYTQSYILNFLFILDFPWYKFSPTKRSWKWSIWRIIWNIFLYSFILYLAFNAAIVRNRKFRKAVIDFYFEYQVTYHQQRLIRFFTLPIFKIYDISKFHNDECLIHNPFIPPGRCIKMFPIH